MALPNSRKTNAKHSERAGFPSFDGGIFLATVFFLSGCGAPGEPQPPQPPIPAAIADLSAQQSGDGVALAFTPPRQTIHGERLTEPPAVEIYRAEAPPGGTPDAKAFRLVYTIPGALLDKYQKDERVHFFDAVSPEEIRASPGKTLVYRLRARVSQKRASADSNAVSVRVFPVPERITGIEARVTESAVELAWPEPTRTAAGDAAPAISGYRIYRGELDPATLDATQKDLSQAAWKRPLSLLAPSTTNRFRDTQFDFGVTYVYVIRSVVLAEDNAIESSDSAPVFVTPRDIFPPAAPQGLVAVYLAPGTPPVAQVELSWSMNVETDLAGYRVYRSEQEGTRGKLLTPDLLPAPAFRDMSIEAGHHYWYSVTAVDRSGNESAPSAAASVEVTQPSP